MRIRILAPAEEDLLAGFRFYEAQTEGLGAYFLDSLFTDIDGLMIHAVLDCRRNPDWLSQRLRQ